MIRAILISLTAVAGTAQAEDLREAPEYFIETVFAVSLSGALARACPSLSVDPAAVNRASLALDEKLAADGFPADDPVSGMTGAQAKMDARQDAFMTTYPLIGASTDEVCAAGRAEMAAGSVLGGLLVEVPQ